VLKNTQATVRIMSWLSASVPHQNSDGIVGAAICLTARYRYVCGCPLFFFFGRATMICKVCPASCSKPMTRLRSANLTSLPSTLRI